MHIELVRVDGALHYRLTQTIGTGNEYHLTEAGLRIQGEHHPGGAGFGTHHALNADGQGNQLVFKTLVHTVGNGPVIEQRSEYFLGRTDDVVHTADIQEGFLLTGKGRIRQVFGGGG